MYIVSNNGDFKCDNIEEFENTLKVCFEEEKGNEIWCSIHSDEEFPCLAILTGKIGASITYFSENNDEQYVSIGNQEGDGMEQVLEGQYEVEKCQIISYEDAMACAMEFFETQQRPNNIEWDALLE